MPAQQFASERVSSRFFIPVEIPELLKSVLSPGKNSICSPRWTTIAFRSMNLAPDAGR